MAKNDVTLPADYGNLLADLKQRIAHTRQRAALALNQELVQLYWHIGRDIVQRQSQQGWGTKVIERLAKDLHAAFPDMKGFSRSNLMSMRLFYESWEDESNVPQLVWQLHRKS